jgi:hypothetical protein
MHCANSPKPWQAGALLQVRRHAYARLLRRLLYGANLAIQPQLEHLPIWMRPGWSGEAALYALHAINAPLTIRLRNPARWLMR